MVLFAKKEQQKPLEKQKSDNFERALESDEGQTGKETRQCMAMAHFLPVCLSKQPWLMFNTARFVCVGVPNRQTCTWLSSIHRHSEMVAYN